VATPLPRFSVQIFLQIYITSVYLAAPITLSLSLPNGEAGLASAQPQAQTPRVGYLISTTAFAPFALTYPRLDIAIFASRISELRFLRASVRDICLRSLSISATLHHLATLSGKLSFLTSTPFPYASIHNGYPQTRWRAPMITTSRLESPLKVSEAVLVA
jgi:hypothetical protein